MAVDDRQPQEIGRGAPTRVVCAKMCGSTSRVANISGGFMRHQLCRARDWRHRPSLARDLAAAQARLRRRSSPEPDLHFDSAGDRRQSPRRRGVETRGQYCDIGRGSALPAPSHRAKDGEFGAGALWRGKSSWARPSCPTPTPARERRAAVQTVSRPRSKHGPSPRRREAGLHAGLR